MPNHSASTKQARGFSGVALSQSSASFVHVSFPSPTGPTFAFASKKSSPTYRPATVSSTSQSTSCQRSLVGLQPLAAMTVKSNTEKARMDTSH